MFSLWIQRADFESRTWAVVSSTDVLAALREHDWASELEHRDELVGRGADWCPPGLGVEDEEGRLLHLCPLDVEHADAHYHRQVWRQLLGLVPMSRNVASTLERLQWRELPPLVERYCSAQHGWLERRFAGSGSVPR
jgi:hypothetical protein